MSRNTFLATRKEKPMLSSILWTAHYFTGVVLIPGALLFLCGAGLYLPIKDESGTIRTRSWAANRERTDER